MSQFVVLLNQLTQNVMKMKWKIECSTAIILNVEKIQFYSLWCSSVSLLWIFLLKFCRFCWCFCPWWCPNLLFVVHLNFLLIADCWFVDLLMWWYFGFNIQFCARFSVFVIWFARVAFYFLFLFNVLYVIILFVYFRV